MKLNDAIKYAYSSGYRITENGQVLSPSGNRLSTYEDRNGYLYFTVSVGGRARNTVSVHRFLAFQKFGEELFKSGIEVRHLNGNNKDNSLNNLDLGTKSQNEMDKDPAIRHRISSTSNRKLTIEEYKSLLEDRKNGLKYKELSEKYGIKKSAISYIVNGKTKYEIFE